MYNIYNLILKLFIIFIILFSILKIIPSENILNKDLILIILINLFIFFIFQKIFN
jgi:ABC-type uncharacterized transport system permease subunit